MMGGCVQGRTLAAVVTIGVALLYASHLVARLVWG